MSIFGKIMGAIFGTHAEAATPAPATEAVEAMPHPHRKLRQRVAMSTSRPFSTRPLPVRRKSWHGGPRSSILMKALDVDSSLSARKELAKELKYPGDIDDSAAMNIWLHKQMMAQLAATEASCRLT